MLFARRGRSEPAGLILTPAGAARQRALRRRRRRLAGEAAARLLAASRHPRAGKG